MRIIVQKFGGTSVGTIDRINQMVRFVRQELDNNNFVVAVVSAMSGFTNQMTSYCSQITNSLEDIIASERDTVIHSGELITAGLFSMALNNSGIKAISLNAAQIPIITDESFSNAYIKHIQNENIISKLKNGFVPVITGFQGITENNRITTLGRGGSDTTAASIAASLNASRIDMYKDVKGIFSIDPRMSRNAKILESLDYKTMLELSMFGSKVIHYRAVEIAMRHNIPIRILFSLSENENECLKEKHAKIKYTEITNKHFGNMESNEITAVTYKKNIFCLKVLNNDGKVLDQVLLLKVKIENISKSHEDYKFVIDIEDVNKVINKVKNLDYEIVYDIGSITLLGYGFWKQKDLIGIITDSMNRNNLQLLSIDISDCKITIIAIGENIELCTTEIHNKVIHKNYN